VEPTHIGKYVVKSRLGQGAMGEVYLAEDPFIARPVAIKWMKTVESGDEQRFLREARIVGSFSHPNIVVLHDFGFHEEKPFLVMEYVPGPNLEGWLKEAHPLADHLRIMEGLCGALTYAHERGVLHRDLKPSNIQVLPDGQCKLLDFGIAHGPAAKLTATGIVMGTPSYMAPEILEDALYSPRADIFSAGVLMYEMLAGSNPFAGRTVAATLTNVLMSQPAPLATRTAVPRELSDAIMACLARDPDRRPRDLSHLLGIVRTLRTQAAPRPIPRAEPTPTRSILGMPTTGRRRRRGSRPIAWTAAVLVAVLTWVVLRASAVGDGPPSPQAEPRVVPATALENAPLPQPVTARPAPAASPSAAPAPRPPARQARQTAPPAPAADDPGPRLTAAASAGPEPPPESRLPEIARSAARPAVVPSAAPPTEVARDLAAPEESPASLTVMSPRTVRRGAMLTLLIQGSGFRQDHQARVLRGRRDAAGIRVTRQRVKEATLVEVNVLVDEDVPLGIYSVALVDDEGLFTNSLTLEVVL
jgi:serine/threonine-protein kinase